MEIIKRIWNYFFGKRKVEAKDYGCQPITIPPLESCGDPVIQSKWIEHKVEKAKPHKPHYYFDHHKMSFRKQQPIGRILNFGKDRFKIHAKIPSTGKFKYDVEKLI